METNGYLKPTYSIDYIFVDSLCSQKEWLCLNCQTQRALSGQLGDMEKIQAPKPMPAKAEKQQPTAPPKVQPAVPREDVAPTATPAASKPAPTKEETVSAELPAVSTPAAQIVVPKDDTGTAAPPAAATVATKTPTAPPASAAQPAGAVVPPKEAEAVAPQKKEAEKALAPDKTVEPVKVLAEPAQTNVPTAELKQAVAVPQVEQVAHAMSGDVGVSVDVDVCAVHVLDVVDVLVREDDRGKEVLTEELPDRKGEIMEPVDRPTGDLVITEGIDKGRQETVDKRAESMDTSTDSMSSDLSLEEQSGTEADNADLVSDVLEEPELYHNSANISEVMGEELPEKICKVAKIASGTEELEICDGQSDMLSVNESAVQNVELYNDVLDTEIPKTTETQSEVVPVVLPEQECESYEDIVEQISEVLFDESETHDASQVDFDGSKIDYDNEEQVKITEELDLFDGNTETVSDVYTDKSEQYADTTKHLSNNLKKDTEMIQEDVEGLPACTENAELISDVFVQEAEVNVEVKEIMVESLEETCKIHVENTEAGSVGSEFPLQHAEVCIVDAEQVSEVSVGESKTDTEKNYISEVSVIDTEMCAEVSETISEACVKDSDMYAEYTDLKSEGLIQEEDACIENKVKEILAESEVPAEKSELLSEVQVQEPDRTDISVEADTVLCDTTEDITSVKNEIITEHVIYTKDYAFTHSIVNDPQEEMAESMSESTVKSCSTKNDVDTFSDKVDEKIYSVDTFTGDSTAVHIDVLLDTQSEMAEGTQDATVEQPPNTTESSITSVDVSTGDIVCTEVLVKEASDTVDNTTEVTCHTVSNEQKESKEAVEISLEDTLSVEILQDRTPDMKVSVTHPVEICTQPPMSTEILLEEVSNTQEEITEWAKIPSSESVSVEVSIEELSDTQEEQAVFVEPSTEESEVKVNIMHCRIVTVLECIDDIVRRSYKKRLNMPTCYHEAYPENCFAFHS